MQPASRAGCDRLSAVAGACARGFCRKVDPVAGTAPIAVEGCISLRLGVDLFLHNDAVSNAAGGLVECGSPVRQGIRSMLGALSHPNRGLH